MYKCNFTMNHHELSFGCQKMNFFCTSNLLLNNLVIIIQKYSIFNLRQLSYILYISGHYYYYLTFIKINNMSFFFFFLIKIHFVVCSRANWNNIKNERIKKFKYVNSVINNLSVLIKCYNDIGKIFAVKGCYI